MTTDEMPRAASAPIRLLLIDDNPDDATLILDHLEESGLRIDASYVDNEKEYLRQMERDWDIILCDYNMPGFSAQNALTHLHRHPSPCPFIIISGSVESTLAADLMLMGASDFIDKNDLSRLTPAMAREFQVSRLRQEKRSIEHSLAKLSNFDEASSLPNAHYFGEKVQNLIEQNINEKYIVGHVNIDRLSSIADIYGEKIIRIVLRDLVERLYQVVNRIYVARLGQHDFGLLLSCDGDCRNCDSAGIAIQHQFTQPFKVDNHELFISPTIGMSCHPCQESTPDKLLRNARYAMQYAYDKQKPYQLFRTEIEQEKIERILISDRLRGAILRDDLSLNYQPKQDARLGHITAIEVLLRWHDEQLGQISPAQFIPIAEATGTIMAIGEWVLRKACQQGSEWRREGVFSGKIAVNLSMRQLRDPKFAQTVADILRESRFPPAMLELEITETDIMKDSELSIQILNQLAKLGITLVIDDFGTGYSSLSYLKKLPIRILKIDRAFVSDIDKSADTLSIVRAILALASSLRLNCVAEGVETHSQMTLLQQEGCDELQGYLISRPLSADQFKTYIRSQLTMPVGAIAQQASIGSGLGTHMRKQQHIANRG